MGYPQPDYKPDDCLLEMSAITQLKSDMNEAVKYPAPWFLFFREEPGPKACHYGLGLFAPAPVASSQSEVGRGSEDTKAWGRRMAACVVTGRC